MTHRLVPVFLRYRKIGLAGMRLFFTTFPKFCFQMKRDLFRRYVWLVDIIRHAGTISYEEISELWKESPLNTDRSPLALRTFHNHRDAIAQLFGIRILCNRSTHDYYIPKEGTHGNETMLRAWMLQSLALSSITDTEKEFDDRVMVDVTPAEQAALPVIFEAMRHSKTIALRYPAIVNDSVYRGEVSVEPYGMRFWHHEWYLLGRNTSTNKLEVFPVAHLMHVRILEVGFSFPEGFSARDYFHRYFGVEVDPDRDPQSIRIRIKGELRHKFRLQPLHASQREVLTEPDSSIFDFSLVPGPLFTRFILSLGNKAEIIAPASLRTEIAGAIRKSLALYE